MKEYLWTFMCISEGLQRKRGKESHCNNLTFENIAFESYTRKGIDVIGVVDCLSPYVIEDIEELVDRGELIEKQGGEWSIERDRY